MVEDPQVNAWLLPSKVCSYPTVNATYNTATYLYSATKSYNRLTQFTVNLAEKTAGAVAQPLLQASKPIITRIEPQLHVYDKYATERLEQLEEKAPLMNEEPAKIYQAAKDTTVTQINQSVGQAVNYALKPVLVAAEKFSTKEAEPETERESEEPMEVPPEEITLQQTMQRAYRVGTKLQNRALERAMQNVNFVRKRSQETLSSLTHAVDLIQYAKNIESATGADKVRGFFHEIFEEEEGEVEKTVESGSEGTANVERKTLVASRNLAKKLRGGYDATMTYAKPYLTEAMFQRLQHGQTLLEGIYQTFLEANTLKDVSDMWIDTTKSNLQYLAQSLREVSMETAQFIQKSTPWYKAGDEHVARGSSDSISSYAPSESLDEECAARYNETPVSEGQTDEIAED